MFNGAKFHDCDTVREKTCAVCAAPFTPRSGVHKFCSTACRGRWKYITGECSTETQYARISGNWERYYSRLCAQKHRKELVREDLIRVHERQKGRCALTGVRLTCQLEYGVICMTNASIDRIEAGGAYETGNIQLVCRAVNQWRGDLSVGEFVDWCRKVAIYADAGEEGS